MFVSFLEKSGELEGLCVFGQGLLVKLPRVVDFLLVPASTHTFHLVSRHFTPVAIFFQHLFQTTGS